MAGDTRQWTGSSARQGSLVAIMYTAAQPTCATVMHHFSHSSLPVLHGWCCISFKTLPHHRCHQAAQVSPGSAAPTAGTRRRQRGAPMASSLLSSACRSCWRVSTSQCAPTPHSTLLCASAIKVCSQHAQQLGKLGLRHSMFVLSCRSRGSRADLGDGTRPHGLLNPPVNPWLADRYKPRQRTRGASSSVEPQPVNGSTGLG